MKPWITPIAMRCAALFAALLSALFLVACGGGSGDDDLPLIFNATLTGAEEVPPVQTSAVGTGIVTVDADRQALTATIVTTGIADNAAHIHEAPPGSSGPIVFPLSKETGSLVWTVRTALTEAQLAALRNGSYYLNVHSPTYPAGEIRGQLVQQMASPEQLARLQQLRAQSALVELQLQQIQQLEDAHERRFTGFGAGFGLGF